MALSADILVAEYEDIIDQTARHLLEQHGDNLPDLSSVCVLTPGQNLSSHFRTCLLNQLADDSKAVIPPFCGTLHHWIDHNIALPDPGITVISEQSRQLLFVEALAQHPHLFREENTWQVSMSLLQLFDELVLNDGSQLDQSEDAWLKTIQQAYNCDQPNPHMQHEARLVLTLWQAWQQQLSANNMLDASHAYAERLRLATTGVNTSLHFYVISADQLMPCEQVLILALVKNNQCTLIEYSNSQPTEPIPAFIAAAYNTDAAPFYQRALDFKQEHGEPALPFSVFYSHDAETEARAVELQTRLWLLEGKRNIGIVSEDRKLSRRARALLERSNVFIQDLSGWSLSTTSAAAALERWLECIEEDFDYRPMLDLLKSHFFRSGNEPDAHLATVYRLEHDVILHENIGHGIPRYRKHLEYRLHRLENWPKQTYDDIVALLNQLEKAAHYLLQLYRATRPVALDKYLESLVNSLEQLGILSSFNDDAAGVMILKTLDDMQHGLSHAAPEMRWRDFRTWLGMTLESCLFSPQTEPSPVRLMSLSQAECQHFDALIIAAADKQHLPGRPEPSPFFNQSVRQSLGLADWKTRRSQRLLHFKRLLQSSSNILITCKTEDNGEPLPLSPWIEALQNFYSLTHNSPIANTHVPALLEQDSAVFICDTRELPPVPERPRPALPADMVPDKMSAGAHQRMIDCPYKYFAGDGLRLSAPDEIREELQKSDYGMRVHTILQAFHIPVKNLPAPFSKILSEANRDEAITHMTRLSEAAFEQDMEDNTLHRSWLYRWLQHIPAYIDWQVRQQQDWTVSETETMNEARFNDIDLTLYGRLDRIDNSTGSNNWKSIIDYKTGSTPAQDEIESGEDVQLASYALLSGDAHSVEYLSLDETKGGVRTKSKIEGEQLRTLVHEVGERLQTVVSMEHDGQALPAWGDQATCRYCDFIGLCRRRIWDPKM